MSKQKIRLRVFFVFFSLGALCVIGFQVPFALSKKTDERKESLITFKTNEVIQKFDGYYRKFIKVTSQGDYAIQDFYNDGSPYSNQYIIKNNDDIHKATNEQTSIDGLYTHFEKNGCTLSIS